MSTVTSKTVVDNIIEHEGLYFENGEATRDPRVHFIIEYNNPFDDRKAWKLLHSVQEFKDLQNSDHAMVSPTLLWRWGGLKVEVTK